MRNQFFDLGFLFNFYSVMGSTACSKTRTLADNRSVAVFRKFGHPCNKSVKIKCVIFVSRARCR